MLSESAHSCLLFRVKQLTRMLGVLRKLTVTGVLPVSFRRSLPLFQSETVLHCSTQSLLTSPPPLPPAISTRSRLNGLRCVRISTFLLLGNSSSSWLLLLSYIITFFAVSFRRSLSYLKPLSPPPQAISTYSIPVHLPGRCTYSIIYSSIDHRAAARRLGANLLRA